MPGELTAVLDIGRTNARLSLIDIETGVTTWHLQRRCAPVPGSSTRSLDIVTVGSLMLAALAGAPGKDRIRAIVPIAHSSAAVWVSRSGEVLAAPDCEDPVFDEVAADYRSLRDPFAATFSPFLPQGLNLGRQIFYIQHKHPALHQKCDAIMLYPQYWAWRLSGVQASEITSLGCHTDLWKPREQTYSDLARNQGWDELLPRIRAATDELGCISPAIARVTGLNPKCRVLCGIQDSNVPYVCHQPRQPAEFAIVAGDTRTLVMAHGSDPNRLHESRDMLASSDTSGSPVPTARFMSAQEYDAIAGDERIRSQPSLGSLASVLKKHAVALPPVVNSGGPFAGHEGKLVNAAGLDSQERAALATVYCALQTDFLLDVLGNGGPLVVEGPLATNPLYGRLLATLRPARVVSVGDYRGSAATECGRVLARTPEKQAVAPLPAAEPLDLPGLEEYRREWRADATSKLPCADQPH